ncbi:MAG: monovalent cation/H(+) antiporter subunit G [Pseudomonadota bacterium]
MSLAADLFLLLGAAFSFLGALGLIRMPDVYNRLQAGTKSVTLGAMAILVGIGLYHPQWWSNLLMIGVLVLFTNPVGSASIARAALIAGIRPWHVPVSTPQRLPAGEGERE